MNQKTQRRTNCRFQHRWAVHIGGMGGWKWEKERGKKLSANEILYQSCHAAGLKKVATFSYLPHFSMPGKKYGIVQIVCIAVCDVVYRSNFVNINL